MYNIIKPYILAFSEKKPLSKKKSIMTRITD